MNVKQIHKVMIKKVIKKKEHFIDPAMSLEGVRNYLKKTVFSNANLAPLAIEANKLKYINQFVQWTTARKDDELFKIFSPVSSKMKYRLTLYGVPYGMYGNRTIKMMYFTIFYYRNFELVAALINDEVLIYTKHSIDRYDEHFLGNTYSDRTINMIGKMLISNNLSWVKRYEYDGIFSYYDIVRDGMYCCTNEKGMWLRKTFISRDMFFPSQVKFYNDNLPELNQYLKEQGIPPINVIMKLRDGMAA